MRRILHRILAEERASGEVGSNWRLRAAGKTSHNECRIRWSGSLGFIEPEYEVKYRVHDQLMAMWNGWGMLPISMTLSPDQ